MFVSMAHLCKIHFIHKFNVLNGYTVGNLHVNDVLMMSTLVKKSFQKKSFFYNMIEKGSRVEAKRVRV